MIAELISVGTELLLGEILNTDAMFLASELSKIGIDVYHQSVVGDNRERLERCVKEAMDRSDIVIASGGLGPTPDDLTKEVLAACAGEKLVLHEESLVRIQRYFAEIKRPMPENNVKQAMMPENGIILDNHNGTAPGCIIEKNGKILIMLPGPPNELTLMYEESVKPYLMKKMQMPLFTKTYHLCGIGEAQAAMDLEELMESSKNPTVAPYAKTGEVHIRVAVKAHSEAEAKKRMAPVCEEIQKKLGQYIYSEDGSSMAQTIVRLLKEQGKTISFAESCTGGLAAKMITDVSGASEVFEESYVTYSNRVKTKLLGVREETLKTLGAVSRETAVQMAEGVKKTAGASIGVGITGIAGPGGGTREKPVGLVYAAVATQDGTESIRLDLNGTRDKIRQSTVMKVFHAVLMHLMDCGKQKDSK